MTYVNKKVTLRTRKRILLTENLRKTKIEKKSFFKSSESRNVPKNLKKALYASKSVVRAKNQNKEN